MTRATTIARRELSSYFYSPVAYVVIVLFLLVFGIMFLFDFRDKEPSEMDTMFEGIVAVLVLVIPLLNMGLIAQEWASGTIETMMTAPISETEVVLGKFLGAFAFFVILLLPTLLYVIVLSIYGHPDMKRLLCGYIGLLLVGALFTAVSMFCSSLTRFQILAVVISWAILIIVTIVPLILSKFVNLLLGLFPTLLPESFTMTTVGKIKGVADQFVYGRYLKFCEGTFNLGNVVFFVAITTFFVFLTIKMLESRRWK